MATCLAGPISSDYFYGWDLLYKTVENVVNKNADILIALAHFLLTRHCSFRCIGIGDDKTLPVDEEGSELIPDHWNEDDTKYALRYTQGGQLYLLLGHIAEDSLIINLLDIKTKNVSNICLQPNDEITATKGSLKKILKDSSALVVRYRKELLQPVIAGNCQDVTTQTTVETNTRRTTDDPLRISEPRRASGHFYAPSLAGPPVFGLPEYGRGDLDPLGRGGGNLFPFPARPSLPGTAQPRFDPYGPPERSMRPNPNPDHLQPPGFGGNYYM